MVVEQSNTGDRKVTANDNNIIKGGNNMETVFDSDKNGLTAITEGGQLRVYGILSETGIISRFPNLPMETMQEIHQSLVGLLQKETAVKRIIANPAAAAYADVDAAGILSNLGYRKCSNDGVDYYEFNIGEAHEKH